MMLPLAALAEFQRRLAQRRVGEDFAPELLAPIAEACGADRVRLYELKRDPQRGPRLVLRTQWWNRPEPPPQAQPQEIPALAHWLDRLSEGASIRARVGDLPASDRAVLEPYGLSSLLVLPILVSGRLWGLLGLGRLGSEADWTEEDAQVLSVAAGALAQDISRERAFNTLDRRDRALSQLADVASEVIYRVEFRPEPRITQISHGIHALTGHMPEQLTGPIQRLLEFVHPDDRAKVGAAELRRVGSNLRYRLRHANGGWVWIERHALPFVDESGELAGYWALAHDVTTEHEALETLARRERDYRELLDGLPDGVVAHRDGLVTYANAAARTMLAPDGETLEGGALAELLELDASLAEHWAKAHTGPSSLPDVPLRRASARVVDLVSMHVSFRGEPSLVTILHDVTERVELRQRLIVSDRLASVGTLAAGVAHEINNPLAFITANVKFLIECVTRADPGALAMRDDMLEALRETQDGCQRVTKIVRDLRTFARADEETRGPVRVASVFDACVKMASSLIFRRAQLVQEVTDDVVVLANEPRLGQVVLNLLVNAAQAIPPANTVRHCIRLSARRASDGFVEISVADDGAGMPPEVMERIFDPFFTTKPVGVGTGLGLTICHGIVTSLGGTIQVDSRTGEGTTVTVTLPAA